VTRAAAIARCVVAVGVLLAASAPSLACQQVSNAGSQAERRQEDMAEQRGIVRRLVQEADSIHVAVATKPSAAMDDVELEIRDTLRGPRPARPVMSFPAGDEITIGCSESAGFRNIDIENGHTYLIYVKNGRLLRAGDRRRGQGLISWKAETALVRSRGRWTLPPQSASFAAGEADFEAAVARWRAAGVSNYSFAWRWRGGVVMAPDCADADIRVRVAAGASIAPVVEHGSARCPRGLRGERALHMDVPATIDAAFEQMSRLVDMGADQVRIHAAYDPTYGIPLSFYAEKLTIEDNDEGFEITDFVVPRH
jgi:hypothetical protein